MSKLFDASALEGFTTLRQRLDSITVNLQGIGGGRSCQGGQETGNALSELTAILLDTVCEGVATLSETGVICATNRRFQEMVQCPAGQVTGVEFSRFVYPADREALRTCLEKAEDEGHPVLLHLRGLDDQSIPVRITAHRLCNKQLGHVCLTVRELSEAHAAVEAHTHLAAIVSTAEEAIIGASLAGTITAWNNAAERVYGHTAVEMIGNHISAIAAPDYVGDFDNITRALEHETGLKRLEMRHQHKDGHLIDVSLSLSPIWSAYGELTGMALIVRDITTVKRSERMIRDSQRFIQKVADTAPYLLYVVDPSTKSAIYCNTRLSALLGYELTPPFVPPDVSPHLCHPDDRALLEAAFGRCGQIGDGERVEVERRVRHARGDWRWFKSTWTIFSRHADGSAEYVMGIAQDTTDRRQLEKALAQRVVDEQQRIGRELHDELGQQLTGICMMLQNLHHRLKERNSPETQLSGEIAEYAVEAQRDLRRLMKGLHPSLLDGAGLNGALALLVEQTHIRSKIECHFSCSEPLGHCGALKATQIYYVAREAITNAVKHACPHRIDLRLHREGGMIVLEVEDDGCGIPEGVEQGEGMGLRIMQYRSRLIHGTLHFESGPHGGALVRLLVPNPVAQPAAQTA